MQSWSIVIFCFNEKGNVKRVINDSVKVLNQLSRNDAELIIVDDGSTDGSVEEIEEEIKKLEKLNVKFIKHPHNLGIGMALKSGYFNASKENVCAVPADGQFNVNELLPFPEIMNKFFICFYRKENQSYSIARNILSMFNKKFNQWMLNITFRDINWVKIYKLQELQKLDLKLNSSLVETEICAKLVAMGNTFQEVESVYLPRNYGVSKGASWEIVKKAISEMIKVYGAVRKFKSKKASFNSFL